jgi:hypothetical protein
MMRRVFLCLLSLLVLIATILTARPAPAPAVQAQPGFGDVPLYFIPNQGQTDAGTLFYAKTPGYTLRLTRGGLVLGETRMRLDNARSGVEVEAIDPADYYVSYFYGRSESDWRAGLPTSRAVLYREVYEGVDLKVYGTAQTVEYDWIVRPGAGPDQIRFGYDDSVQTRLERDGGIVVKSAAGELEHRKPRAYQIVDGTRVEVQAAFRALGNADYGFELGPYDRTRELVIDPLVLVFSTYLGGRTMDNAWGIGIDPTGAIYVAGYTDSIDFPPLKAQKPRMDAYITKFAPDGKSLVFSTFFPIGTWGFILDTAVAERVLADPAALRGRHLNGVTLDSFLHSGAALFKVDPSGAAYLSGTTSNENFPAKNAYQPNYGGGWYDGFFLKLAPNGKSLVFSSFLGGPHEESVEALAIDAQGSLYLGGLKGSIFRGLPINQGGVLVGGGADVYIIKFKADGKTKVYEKDMGIAGWFFNSIADLKVDAAGAAYVIGSTGNLNLPVQNAFQKKYGGGLADMFVFKLAPSGVVYEYCSYLGGPNFEVGCSIDVDGQGAAYITGYTYGTIPVKNAFRKSRMGDADVFLAKVNPNGKTLGYATYLGGEGTDIPFDIKVDAEGHALIVGETTSASFPVKDALKAAKSGTWDGFLTAFSRDGRSLYFSTLFGGSYSDALAGLALDDQGGIFMAGFTNSVDLPVLNPYQAENAGGWQDAFVVKLKR